MLRTITFLPQDGVTRCEHAWKNGKRPIH